MLDPNQSDQEETQFSEETWEAVRDAINDVVEDYLESTQEDD